MLKLEKGEDQVIMNITGLLVELLIKLALEIYGPFTVFENGKKILYLEVLRALYGMLVAALLWYKTLQKDLEKVGFIFNPHDPCVCNK